MRTKAIIHLDRFRDNLCAVQKRVGPQRKICVPVKADAYGHGALQIARASLQAGVFCLAVAAVEEGKELRGGGIKAPILLLSQAHPEETSALVKASLSPVVSDIDYVNRLNAEAAASGVKLQVHLKIDTGMGRMGTRPEDAAGFARHISSCPALEYAGTATHFAVSESSAADDVAYTRRQIDLFMEAIASIRALGIDTGIIHAANSGAVLLYPEAWLDMVRPGILLYGYKQAQEAGPQAMSITPVMELRSCVSFIKKVKKGESLSYGRTWIAGADTIAAVLPIGYADGLPRSASNKWQVIIGGRSYPLAGRICMDMCLVDLGPDAQVNLWDEAVIFGGGNAAASPLVPSAADLAERVGSIPYEITCNISKRVPREYKE